MNVQLLQCKVRVMRRTFPIAFRPGTLSHSVFEPFFRMMVVFLRSGAPVYFYYACDYDDDEAYYFLATAVFIVVSVLYLFLIKYIIVVIDFENRKS